MTRSQILQLAKKGASKALEPHWDTDGFPPLINLFEKAVTDYRTVRRKAGHGEILWRCLEAGLKPDRALVWMAARHGNVEIVERMVRIGEVRNDPFVLACLGDEVALRRCGETVALPECRDDRGLNLLHYVAGSGLGRENPDRAAELAATCRMLIEVGVSPSLVVELDLSVSPVFFCAAHGGNPAIMNALLETGEIEVESLHQDLEFAIEPHQRSGPPFSDVAEMLLERGFDLNSLRPDQGRTLLHGSANRGSKTAVRWLMDHGADVRVRDQEGRTPLHVAAVRNTHTAVVEMLVAAGADIGAIDQGGKTALVLARENGRAKVDRYLESV